MTDPKVLGLVHEPAYESLVNRLITKTQSDGSTPDKRPLIEAKQQELITKVGEGTTRCAAYLAKQLQTESLSRLVSAVPAIPKLTAQEMARLPKQAEQRVANRLSALSPQEASTPAFWFACHVVWIKQDVFGDLVSTFLENTAGSEPNNEAQVRNFLRRTGGLEQVRGKVSVLTDCPVSAAWWRVRMARSVSDASSGNLSFADAHSVLHHPTVWTTLTSYAVKQLTAITSPKALAAALAALHANNNGDVTKEQAVGVLRAVGRLNHTYCLEHVSWNRLHETAKSGLS